MPIIGITKNVKILYYTIILFNLKNISQLNFYYFRIEKTLQYNFKYIVLIVM